MTSANIKDIFLYHKKRYRYHRITLELINKKYELSYKKVYRIMFKLKQLMI